MHQHQTHTTHILFTQCGELLQDNSYYPFGMLMTGLDYSTGTSPENKYLYNGKELQDDFELALSLNTMTISELKELFNNL